MDRLRQLWNNINAQLGVLTVSQRLAIGLCAALVAVSLLLLMQWSTAPELVPLVRQDFSFEEMDAAEEGLRKEGIAFEVRGSRLYIRPADQHNALRVAAGAGALPDGSLLDMEAVVTDANPFQSPEARVYAQNYAKGNELAKIIATSPFVKKASVIVNPETKRRLGGHTDVPSASVSVTLTPGREMTTEIVEGFANLVAGAVAGLKPHNVYITDARSGRSFSVPQPGDAASFDLLGMEQRREEHFTAKILGTLSDIPGVQVAVSVQLDASKRVTTSQEHDAPQPKKEQSKSTDQSSSLRPGEPGVVANTGTALSGGANGQSSKQDESTTENFEPKLTKTETVEELPFTPKKVTAAIGIPRSFVVGVFRAQNPQIEEDPKDDDPGFTTVRDAQTSRVRAAVERIIMAQSPDDVEVNVYPDMDWTADGGQWSRAPGGVVLAGESAQMGDTVGMVRMYGPQLGLAMLALASLFMMLRVARRSSELVATGRQRSHEPASMPDEEPFLTVGPSSVGQAEPSESLLAGKEVDPETLRYQELGHEVSKMVVGNPDAAAELIRRWIEDST